MTQNNFLSNLFLIKVIKILRLILQNFELIIVLLEALKVKKTQIQLKILFLLITYQRERLLEFKERQHEQILKKIKQTQLPKIEKIRIEEKSSQKLYQARLIEKTALDKHRKLRQTSIEKKNFKRIQEETPEDNKKPESGRVSQLIARDFNEDYQPTPKQIPTPNQQDDPNSATIKESLQQNIKNKLKNKIIQKINAPITTQTQAFIKIRGEAGVTNKTVESGQWGKTSLSDQINQFTSDFSQNIKLKNQKPILDKKQIKHVTKQNFKELSHKLQQSLNKQQKVKLTGFGPEIKGSPIGLVRGDTFEEMPELLKFDRNIKIKVGTKSGETSRAASEEEVTIEDIQNFSASVTTFERVHPEFKTGITPINQMNKSEMNTTQMSEYLKAEVRQKIYKKQDFDIINRRQKMFKELADALRPEFEQKLLERSAQVDYQLTQDEVKEFEIHKYLMQSEMFALNSNILKMDTNTFSEKSFPFQNQSKGIGVKAYNQNNNRKQKSPLASDQTKLSSKDQQKQIELEEYKLLVSDRKKFDKETMADVLNYFFEYIQIEPFEENIAQIFNMLSETYLSQAIMDSDTLKNNPILQAFLINIQNKQRFFDKVKQYQRQPKVQEQLRKDDADIIFFQTCQEANQPTFSLLQKVKQKSLHLIGYRLDEILCKAFENSVQLKPDLLNECLLDSNGLKDNGLSYFIQGLSRMKLIKKIIIKNNEFGQRSFESIKSIILKEKPQHLEELRLTDCKLSSQLTNKVLELLNLGDKFKEQERIIESEEEYSDEDDAQYIQQTNILSKFDKPSVCVLRKLGLVNANISQECIGNLVHLLKTSRFLTDFDLSYNELSSNSLVLLVDELKENRRLQNLNLSWNRFKINKGITKQVKEDVERKMDADEQKIIDGICVFIKHNPKLLHFDLSYTGLTKLMLIEFGPALRKSKSLITLHLTGNPGIDQELLNQIHERAHCRPLIPVLNIEQFNPPVNLNSNSKKKKQAPVLVNQYGQLQGGLQVRQFKEDMLRRDDGRLERGFSLSEDRILIMERILGHKNDMPGSGQWRQIIVGNQKCWVCHNFVYSIIIWSVTIGHRYLEINNKGISDDDFIQKIQILQERMEEEVKKQRDLDRSHKDYYNIKFGRELYSQGIPIIQGQFTNWHPQKMIPLEDFCLEIDTDAPNFFDRMKNQNLCRNSCETSEDFNETEKKIYEYYKFEYKQEYRENWQKVFQDYLPYKKPFLINKELVSNEELLLGPNGKRLQPPISEQSSQKTKNQNLKNHASMISNLTGSAKKTEVKSYDMPLISPIEQDNQVFVYPCLMKPGKNNYIIRYDPIPQNISIKKMQRTLKSNKTLEISETSSLDTDFDETSQYFTHTVMAPFRDEDIPINVKTFGTKKFIYVFQKNNSVFRDWREDNPERLEQGVEHDLTYWKARKFIKKDLDDLQGVDQLVRKHFEVLKVVHTYYASCSNFPYLLPFEFSQFITKFGIQNKDLPFQQIDTNFIASYSSMGKLQGTADNMLLRLQFIECITRCAASKYKDSGKVKTFTEALQMMIENEIIPNSRDIWEEWHMFRIKKLWTKDVNELFKANLQNCNRLMETYFQPRQKYLDVKDAISIFTKQTDLITEKEANFCYGMSKMPNPIETKDIIKHRQITSVTEFMEIIARVAETKFKSVPATKYPEEKQTKTIQQNLEENENEQNNENGENNENYKEQRAQEVINMPLTEKIELVMDKIFALISCRTNIPIPGGDKDESQSDEDY